MEYDKWYQKEYRSRDKVIDRHKTYQKEYRESHKQERNEYHDRRYNEDFNYKMSFILRNRIRDAINGNFKSGSAIKDLGCTIDELKKHIESLFQPNMTWDNWSPTGWHIDHKRPLASFDLANREEFLKACHYTNLQPLWASDNLKKSNKYEVSK